MAGIVFKCPHCDHSVASDDNLCGEIAECPECKEEIVVPIPGLEKDNVYGDFKLMARLGSGASGEVWLAHQQSMDRKVALKVLCPKLSADKNFIDRFMKEAKNSAKLAHPNIVTAFYAGQDKGMYYLAISYVNGETIESKLERETIYEEKEALRIIRSIASALQYAWDEFQILHRDIKPANIIVNKKGVPMLLDLGISKSMKEDSSLTMTGTVIGTPYYMSPEQAVADKDMDFRSDIYSLGTTLYHMLTGNVPYYATTAMAIIMKHINDKFEPPRKHNPKISKPCSKLIEIMMAKKRGERQQSWNALLKDIDLVLEGKNPSTLLPAGGSTVERETTVGKEQASDKTPADAKKEVKPTPAAPKKKSGSGTKIFVILAAVFVIVLIPVFIIGLGLWFYFSNKQAVVPDNTSNSTSSTNQNTVSTTRNVFDPETTTTPVSTPEVKNVTPPETSETKTTPVTTPKTTPTTPVVKTTPTPPKTVETPPQISAFQKFADELDVTKQTPLHVKEFWREADGKEYTFSGKIVNAQSSWGKAELQVASEGRALYRGYNIILVSQDKDAAAALQIGQKIKFKGTIYNYKGKSDGLVIVYMKDVSFLND